MATKICLVLAGLFVCLSGVMSKKGQKAGFQIYHEIPKRGGMCLFAKGAEGSSGHFEPYLSTKCLAENKAWMWSRYHNGLLKSLLASKCLGIQKLADGSKIGLYPCDPSNEHQRWTCGSGYRLQLGGYQMTHSLVVDGWHVTGAFPVLKLDKHHEHTWIVYVQDDMKQATAICDIATKEQVGKGLIFTAPGGMVVGEPCIFPFIRGGKETWNCFMRAIGGVEHHVCATSPNLDKNKGEWGICPPSKRGTVSDWMPPPLCDRPCGAGQLLLTRRCLFAPCSLPLQKSVVGEACNTAPCSGDRVLSYGGSSFLFPADGIYPVTGYILYGQCVFPFVFEGISTTECISSLERSEKWCSLTENYDKHKKWGYCVSYFKGAWTKWTTENDAGVEASCSTSCGGGVVNMMRFCRYAPCKGYGRSTGKRCNTQPCPDCFDTVTRVYRGRKSTAADGSECQAWSSQTPNRHTENPLHNRDLVENFCRLPNKKRFQPYCYIIGDDRFRERTPKAWLYCDIPPCGLNYTLNTIPYTVPVHPFDDINLYSAGFACSFPFRVAKGELMDRCASTLPIGREFCRVEGAVDGGKDIAYCPGYFRGRWSGWRRSKECTTRCGGGKLLAYRICLLAPCAGSSIRLTKQPCNTLPCVWSTPATKDCYNGVGMMYKGTRDITITGSLCQHWNRQTPVSHNMHPKMMPAGMPPLESNYCRNPTPGIRNAPWCYSDSKIDTAYPTWEYCDVAKCPTKEDEIFAVSLLKYSDPQGPHPCIFPFHGADGQEHSECYRTGISKFAGITRYCAISEDGSWSSSVLSGLLTGKYGICPTVTKGTSAPWNRTACSKTCGGGFWVLRRKCLHPPCQEQTKLDKKAHCNTHKCLDCFVGQGQDYGGSYHKTFSGKECSEWPASNMGYNKEHYKELKNNYCRNPDARKPIPWCYAGDDMQQTYCDVKHCIRTEIAYTVPRDGGFATRGEKCAFPFENNTEVYWSCQRIDKGYFCPLIKNLQNLKISQLAMCPPSYVGAWSAWRNVYSCDRTCGSGRFLYIRDCLYPPCNGTASKYEGKCNTHRCKWPHPRENVDCFLNNGYDYRGDVSVTFSGMPCMQWKHRFPHKHEYVYEYSGKELDNNFCRNPAPDLRYAPWCFTASTAVRWQYCDVPYCPSRDGEIVTFIPWYMKKPCTFPFTLGGTSHASCIAHPLEKRSKKKSICGTERSVVITDKSTWGYCVESLKGMWSAWSVIRSDGCSKKCGGGNYRYKRVCRFLPCKGPEYVMQGACNTKPCDECYKVATNGSDYLGLYSMTWNGVKCKKQRHGNEYHSFCRNPIPRLFSSPWCVTSARQGRKVPCGIKLCPEKRTEGVIMAYNDRTGQLRPCSFPFWYKNMYMESCQPLEGRTFLWCSLGDKYGGAANKAPCLKIYEGAWSTWSEASSCSKPCGVGEVIHMRHCRYPPCRGHPTKQSEPCNTQPCNGTTNCYRVADGGKAYRGSLSESLYGKPCIAWPADITAKYPAISFSRNQCRNPGGESYRPWCVVEGGRYEFCDVPACPVVAESPSASPLVVRLKSERGVSLPCIFPFVYKSKLYHSCTSDPPPGKTFRSTAWCSTVRKHEWTPGPELHDEYGFCRNKHRGIWMTWAGSERSCTTDCFILIKRHCLHEPCKGYVYRTTGERCYTEPCQKVTLSMWNSWSACGSCDTLAMRTRSCEKNCDLDEGWTTETETKPCQNMQEAPQQKWGSSGDTCRLLHTRHSVETYEVVEVIGAYMKRVSLSSATKLLPVMCPQLFLTLLVFFALL